MKDVKKSELIIYQTADGKTKVDVRFEGENVWLTQEQMAILFEKDQSVISRHIKNVFEEGELDQKSNMQNMHTAISDKPIATYSLDVIISVGYRVKSLRGTQFRIWATERLKEYMIKGFTMDDTRLKESGGGDYWRELLERIRDIRSSEKALYRQVLDLYATSIDYNSKSQESIVFFKVVQNKLHYATNQQTAAELIYTRADAKKEFMGMTTFAGPLPLKSEVTVAKNYLNENELFRLNRLVSAFFDLAEIKAQDHKQMHMKDWVAELEKFSGMYGKGVLRDAGKVSHRKAVEKAEKEYRTYQAQTLSPIERAYFDTIKKVQKKVEQKVKKQRPKHKK